MKILDKPNLPKEIFGLEAKPELLAQAVRVFLANHHQGTQSALTRSEVNRTRKKLYKQKGTGGARHGDRKAPIFVGGGVSFAPKPRDFSLKLPEKMKKLALHTALSLQAKEKKVSIVSAMIKLSGKTSELAKFLAKDKGSILIITDLFRPNVYRAAKNIESVTVLPMNQVNTYEVLKANQILIMEEAITEPKKAVAKKKS